MLSAPKRFAAALAIAAFLSGLICYSSRSQGSANLLSPDLSVSPRDSDSAADAVGQELLDLGRNGEVIQRVRSEIVALLSEESPCSAWFRAAEPEAVDKFRSLRFAVDAAGSSDVTTPDLTDSRVSVQPYVARTGQNVGPGSTITLNANGAFFREMARVRSLRPPSDLILRDSFRSLVVGDFAGATPAARILTVLHELAHVVDMLPVDAGFPGASLVSTHNTETVLKYCGPQIRAHAKRLQKSENTKSLTQRSAAPAAAFTLAQPTLAKLPNTLRDRDWPSAELFPRSTSFSSSLDAAPRHLALARRMRSDMFLPEPLP